MRNHAGPSLRLQCASRSWRRAPAPSAESLHKPRNLPGWHRESRLSACVVVANRRALETGHRSRSTVSDLRTRARSQKSKAGMLKSCWQRSHARRPSCKGPPLTGRPFCYPPPPFAPALRSRFFHSENADYRKQTATVPTALCRQRARQRRGSKPQKTGGLTPTP